MSQGTGDIHDGIALVQRAKLPGAHAHRLADHLDRALLRIPIEKGQREPLPFFVDTQDDELTWRRSLGQIAGLEFNKIYFAGDLFFPGDLMHDDSILEICMGCF